MKMAVPQMLANYCAVARKIMLSYMHPNSCIGATRVTCLCLKSLGYSVEPMAVKFYVEVPELNLGYMSGGTAVDIKNAITKRCRVQAQGSLGDWNGHLIALVNSCWIADSAFDQVDATLGGKLHLPKEVVLLPLPKSFTSLQGFHAAYNAQDNLGRKMRIQYATTGDQLWRISPAWNDEGLAALAAVVLKEMKEKVAAPATVK